MLNVFESIFAEFTIIFKLWYVAAVAVSSIYEIFGTNLLFLHRKPSNSGVMFLWCVRDKLALISVSLSFLIFFVVTTPYFLFLVPSSLRSTSFVWLIERDNLFCLDVILNLANNLLPTQMHFSFSFSYTFSIFADCDLIFTRCCLNDIIFKSCAVWMDLKPLTPIDLGIYKRSMSLLRLKFD